MPCAELDDAQFAWRGQMNGLMSDQGVLSLLFRQGRVWPPLSLYRANEPALSVMVIQRLSPNIVDYLSQDPGIRDR
jgi:hypothetical protein